MCRYGVGECKHISNKYSWRNGEMHWLQVRINKNTLTLRNNNWHILLMSVQSERKIQFNMCHRCEYLILYVVIQHFSHRKFNNNFTSLRTTFSFVICLFTLLSLLIYPKLDNMSPFLGKGTSWFWEQCLPAQLFLWINTIW